MGSQSLFQLSLGARRGTPWTGCKPIAAILLHLTLNARSSHWPPCKFYQGPNNVLITLHLCTILNYAVVKLWCSSVWFCIAMRCCSFKRGTAGAPHAHTQTCIQTQLCSTLLAFTQHIATVYPITTIMLWTTVAEQRWDDFTSVLNTLEW